MKRTPALEDTPTQTSFERFEEFARKVISVPKSEIEERERIYRETRKREEREKSGG